jgi:hypothetical protein
MVFMLSKSEILPYVKTNKLSVAVSWILAEDRRLEGQRQRTVTLSLTGQQASYSVSVPLAVQRGSGKHSM